MTDQLTLPQSLALTILRREPLFLGKVGWAPKGDDRRGFGTRTIEGLRSRGFAIIRFPKASITARGKRFLEAEGK